MEMPPSERQTQSEPETQSLHEIKKEQYFQDQDKSNGPNLVVKENKKNWYQRLTDKLKQLRRTPKSSIECVDVNESTVGNLDNWIKSVFDYLRNLFLCVALALLGPYIYSNQIDLDIDGLATVVGHSLPWIAFSLAVLNSLHLAAKLMYLGSSKRRKILSGVFWGGFIIVNILLFAAAANQQQDLLTPENTKKLIIEPPSDQTQSDERELP